MSEKLNEEGVMYKGELVPVSRLEKILAVKTKKYKDVIDASTKEIARIEAQKKAAEAELAKFDVVFAKLKKEKDRVAGFTKDVKTSSAEAEYNKSTGKIGIGNRSLKEEIINLSY